MWLQSATYTQVLDENEEKVGRKKQHQLHRAHISQTPKVDIIKSG